MGLQDFRLRNNPFSQHAFVALEVLKLLLDAKVGAVMPSCDGKCAWKTWKTKSIQ
jgi:hypothetical protein